MVTEDKKDPNNLRLKNLIFDWSGTLSDDFSTVYNATMGYFRKIGLQTISKERFRKEFCLPYMNFFRRYTDMPKKEIDHLFITEYRLLPPPKAFEDGKKLLAELYSKGYNLAVLSSHRNDELKQEIKTAGFSQYFMEIVGSVHDKRDALGAILERNNFRKEETAYIGDMTHDIDAAKSAGVNSIAILGGYDSKEKLASKNPDIIVSGREELKYLLC